MSILFDYNINYLSDCDNNSTLPFSIFGISQQGVSHFGSSIGNQDAGNIFIGKNVLIGCVADGCTCGNNLNGKSSNQVGANLTSYLICRIARKLVIKKQISLSNIKNPLERDLLIHYKRIRNTLNPWKFEKHSVVNNFMASSFLMFIVTRNEYLVLSCGDGNAYINGNIINLVNEGGEYFSNNLFQNENSVDDTNNLNLNVPIKILQEGNTKDLNSILISTDGFIDEDVTDIKAFKTFFFENQFSELKNGFNDLIFQFRTNIVEKVLEEKDGRIWPLDDATFISLKRTT